MSTPARCWVACKTRRALDHRWRSGATLHAAAQHHFSRASRRARRDRPSVRRPAMSLAAETLPCSMCRAPVDPLRAPRVAHFDEHFCYFCSQECDAKYRHGGPARSAGRPPLTSETVEAPLPSFQVPGWEREPLGAAVDGEGTEAAKEAEEAAPILDAPARAGQDAIRAGRIRSLVTPARFFFRSRCFGATHRSFLADRTRAFAGRPTRSASWPTRLVVNARWSTACHGSCPLSTLCGPVVPVGPPSFGFVREPESESCHRAVGVVTLCAPQLAMVLRARSPLELGACTAVVLGHACS